MVGIEHLEEPWQRRQHAEWVPPGPGDASVRAPRPGPGANPPPVEGIGEAKRPVVQRHIRFVPCRSPVQGAQLELVAGVGSDDLAPIREDVRIPVRTYV